MIKISQLAFVAIFSMMLTTFMHAQNSNRPLRMGISVGTAMPVGGFADESSSDCRSAYIGPCIKVDAVNQLQDDFFWITSADFNCNKARKGPYEKGKNITNVSAGYYYTTDFLTGPCINITTSPSSNIKLFVELGLQLVFTPKISYTIPENQITLGPDMAGSFTPCLGCIVNFSKISLSLRYVAASPEVTENIHPAVFIYPPQNIVDLSTEMVQFLVGVTF